MSPGQPPLAAGESCSAPAGNAARGNVTPASKDRTGQGRTGSTGTTSPTHVGRTHACPSSGHCTQASCSRAPQGEQRGVGAEQPSPPPGKGDAVGSSACISPGSSGEGELENQHNIPQQGEEHVGKDRR